MDRYVGKTLNEKYQITDIIGIGGMSVVYKAKDLYNDRDVAIKILKDEFNADEKFKNRFINESRVISMLSHKNIVDVVDVHIDDDLQYIVMEHVDGITLKQYMSKRGALEWRETVFFADQILRGLQHAHERGIVHRDVKPHNIMLLPDGTIKVADFGIARFQKYDTATIADKAMGTVQYISPEQASKGKVDIKSDIYSLGITLYEMLTGVLPFDGDSPVNIALKQIRNKPKPPSEINPSIPKGLEEIVLKAISKRPENRFSSAEEMREAIVRIRDNPATVFNYKIVNDSLDTEDRQGMKKLKKQTKAGSFLRRHNMLFSFPVFLGLLLGVTFSVGVWYFVTDLIGSANEGYVEVPNFVGMIADDIQSNSQYEGKFKFTVTESYSGSYEAGIVIGQTPDRNTKVLKNTTVELTVSKGIRTAEIPAIVGNDVDSVVIILQNLGFVVNTEYQYSDTVGEKKVISCSPDEKTSLPYGSEILLTVSRGKQVTLVRVPSVLGKDVNDAIQLLSDAEFVVMVEYESSDTVRVNAVISQSEAPATQLPKKTVITITVSEGPGEISDASSEAEPSESSEAASVPD